MPLTDLDLLLWVTGFVAHVALLLILLLRGRARRFPVFTTLIVLNVTRTLVLFLISREGTKAMYFYTFWSVASADVALQFGVVYELASKVFRPLGPTRKMPDLVRQQVSVINRALESRLNGLRSEGGS